MSDHLQQDSKTKDRVQDENRALVKGLLYAMVTVAVLMLGYLYFDKALHQQHNPNQTPTTRSEHGSKTVILQRNKFGHYVSNGTINGQQVQFFLDTGATDVSIPAHIAKKLQLKKGARHSVSTANGTISVYSTLLDSIAIGSIQLRQVRAGINPATDSDDILLGMSFLKELDFSQAGDQLTIRQTDRNR